MRQIITDAHAKLIGERDEPVEITGAQLVQLDRDQEAVADVPSVDAARRGGRRARARSAQALALGHPDRRRSSAPSPCCSDSSPTPARPTPCSASGRSASSAGVFDDRARLPRARVPDLRRSPTTSWVSAPSRRSPDYALPVVARSAAIVLIAGGIALMIGVDVGRPVAARRGHHRSPIRYGDQHRWSWTALSRYSVTLGRRTRRRRRRSASRRPRCASPRSATARRGQAAAARRG